MKINSLYKLIFVPMFYFVASAPPACADEKYPDTLHQRHQLWNAFVDKLYLLHRNRLADDNYYTNENIGGYGGQIDNLEYYREVHYYDRDSRQLLSTVKWNETYPFGIHMIDVFIYDDSGRVLREYSATYLPSRYTSPAETLIILHNYNDSLHSFREFDASNVQLYEQCEKLNGEIVFALHYVDIPDSLSQLEKEKQQDYRACFGHVAESAGIYIDPMVELSTLH
ncbi:MAG: hypothetical protein KAJ95_05860 [Gammaproteobacteria bacterium]|nr:hypothetical protein [Gammaproteobacteria bacterium]